MANPVELIPLLVVALVLIGAGGADVTAIDVAVEGDRTVTELEDVLIVGGGTVTVPAGERVQGPVYVVGGDAVVAGTVEGDVVQLAGNLTVADGARVGGELRTVAGEARVDPGASVASRTDVPGELTPRRRSPLEQATALLARALALALVGAAVASRRPTLLDNVGNAVAEHPVVSATVGLLATATGIALVVFMAITVILLPVSLLGILLGIAVVGYAYLAVGHLLGRRLPVERPAVATAAGTAAVVVALDLVGRVPLVGAVVGPALLLTGIGAVLITYFGLAEFEPVDLPE